MKTNLLLATLVLVPVIVAQEVPPAKEPAKPTTPGAAERKVPAGFKAAEGAKPEPYSNTGWAQEIMHEQTGMAMVYVPAGEFLMGSPAEEKDRENDEIQHRVTLTRGFYLGKYEVTQGQWEMVTGKNWSHVKGRDNPVVNVSWDDCQVLIQKLNAALPLPITDVGSSITGVFRLPTEAEWEYACRAGTKGAYAGDNLDDLAWYEKNSGMTTHPAGQKKPNSWGLFDMHGNVSEWCNDWYRRYPSDTVTDPSGPGTGDIRVYRGGNWGEGARYCRAAYRAGESAANRRIYIGLRLVLVLPQGQRQATTTTAAKMEQAQVPAEGADWMVPDLGMEFVWVQAMKLHVGKYEVTNAEYRKKEPKHDSRDDLDQDLDGDRQPVVFVSFDHAKAYTAWLTAREHAAGRLPAGWQYRLPTETEWVGLAQCGDKRKYPWGNKMPPKYGNYADRSAKDASTRWKEPIFDPIIEGYDDGFAVTCIVDKSGKNDWGLYGVGGNVWEIVSDKSGGFGGWCGASYSQGSARSLGCTFCIRPGNSALAQDAGFRVVLSH